MSNMQLSKRSSQGCICCGSASLKKVSTVVSPFLAKKGWSGDPELTYLVSCAQCGFRFYDRGLSSMEAERYYAGYRDEEYFKTRHQFEIFYTRKAHEETGNWLTSAARRSAVSQALEQAGAPRVFSAALDFGGGTGHMLLGIEAAKKAVFDLSKEEAEPGLISFGAREEIKGGWDLILSCQVLEHLSDPFDQVKDITNLLSKGGWIYAEVPDQSWREIGSPEAVQNAWLSLLLKSPRALHAADFVSTAFRVKLGFLPPLAFAPMREHVNYFTVQALTELLTRAGLTVSWSGKNVLQCICAVAKKD